jgi:hypothetical protein
VAVSPGSRAFDYELEVAVVIGREGADLSPEEAMDHIAGYVLFCDWSAREVQGEEMKFNLGPPTGQGLGVELRAVDAHRRRAGTGRRDGRLGQRRALQRRPARHPVLELRRDGRLRLPRDAGDSGRPVGTGTVGTGCILELSRVPGIEAFPWLIPGDRVRVEVDGLGAIDARVVEGAPVRPLRDPRPTTAEGHL